RPGRRLGTILVELNAIDSEDLLSSLEHQVKERLLDVFTWTTGEYEPARSEPGKEDVSTLNFSMENLIVAGGRRIRAWSRMARATEGRVEREREMDREDVGEKFNQMLSRIHSFLRGRSGDDVDRFMEEALARVAARYATLFYGIDLKQYGRADYEQMLANVA